MQNLSPKEIPRANPTEEQFAQWLRLPGNEIYANLDLQKKLPGMNARTYNAGLPVPGTGVSQADVEEEIVGPVEEKPATYNRQWHSPVSRLREQMPGLIIMQWPAQIVMVKSAIANGVFRVILPLEAKLIKITGGSPAGGGQVLISPYPFTMPLANTATEGVDATNPNSTTDPMVITGGTCGDTWWACEGLRELFVGLETLGDHVSLAFWSSEGPRTL